MLTSPAKDSGAPKMLSSPHAGSGAKMPSSPPQSVEGESLVASAQTSGGELIVQDMSQFGTSWSGGSQLAWSPGQIGAQLRLAPAVAAAGRYQVIVVWTQAPDYGNLQVSLDGAPVVPLDGYAPAIGRQRRLRPPFDLAAGTHELLFAVSGKDARSTGLLAGINRVDFIRIP